MKVFFTCVFLICSLFSISQEFSKEELQGKINPSTHPSFSKIPNGYSTRSQDYLRTDVVNAFLEMASAAKQEGIELIIVSATRNFDRQAAIWNRKWNNLDLRKSKRASKILTYSSMPGTSRHHWGTDFDINSVEPTYFKTGKGKQVYEWLFLNAYKYGFFQPYQEYKNEPRSGYFEEKWHWSYYPIASKMLAQYNSKITEEDLEGFEGSKYADDIEVIAKYVNGIITYPFTLGYYPLPKLDKPELVADVKIEVSKSRPVLESQTTSTTIITPKENKMQPIAREKIVVEYFSERPEFKSQKRDLTFRNWINSQSN